MKPKKSKKADLEPRKPLFFKLGLVLALTTVFFAFEWKQTEKEQIVQDPIDVGGDQDIWTAPPTKPDPPSKPHIAPISTATFLFTKDPNEAIDLSGTFNPEPDPDFDTKYDPVVDPEEKGGADITDSAMIVVDFDAEYPGGVTAMKQFIAEKITYPEEERQIGMEGTLYVSFVVERSGAVSNVEVARSLSPNLDNEAVRVIRMMPKWKPAMDHGKAARQKFTIPFLFKIK